MLDFAGWGISIAVSAGAGVLAVVLFALKDPDRFDKWLALVARGWARLGVFAQWLARARTRYAVQASLNEIMADLASRAPYATAPRIAVRFIASADEAQAALQDGQLLIRLCEQEDREGDIAAALPFALSKVVLRTTRMSLSIEQRLAMDLYLSYALATRHGEAIADRVRSTLIDNADSATRACFARYARLDAGGLLFETFLAELDFVEERALLACPDPEVLSHDAEALLSMLEPHIGRYVDEAVDTTCIGSLVRCGVVIIGKGETIQERPEAWTAYVRHRLLPRATESVHLRGPAHNARVIHETVGLLSPTYHLVREGQTTSRLRDRSGVEFDQPSYFAILRLAGSVAQRDALAAYGGATVSDGVVGLVASWQARAGSGHVRALDFRTGRSVFASFTKEQCVNPPPSIRPGMAVLCRLHEVADELGESSEALVSVEFVTSIGPDVRGPDHGDDAEAEEDRRQAEDHRATEAGYEFGRQWAAGLSARGLAATIRGRPNITGDTDAELLRAAERAVGFALRGEDELRHAARDGFWQAVEELSGAGDR